MKKETEYLIHTLQTVLSGEPWYGRPVMGLLQEIDPAMVYRKPAETSHSLIELLYHMITWAEFTLRQLDKNPEQDTTSLEKLDWREIDPAEHTWEKGLAQFKVTHDLIIEALETKEDDFLSGQVEHRRYNFRFLLNGIIQHDIYHIGQIAYVKKLLEAS